MFYSSFKRLHFFRQQNERPIDKYHDSSSLQITFHFSFVQTILTFLSGGRILNFNFLVSQENVNGKVIPFIFVTFCAIRHITTFSTTARNEFEVAISQSLERSLDIIML